MLYKKLLIVAAVIFCLMTNFSCVSIKTQKEASADKTNREANAEHNTTQRSVSVKPTTNEKEIYDKSYALVIGVSQYTSWRSLPGVKIDVSLVSEALEKQGFDVQVAMDPTRTGFDETMRKFISDYGLSPKNRLLIYFAGHGHTITTPDNRNLGYIVPSDAALPEDLSSFLNKAISMQEIMVYAKQIQSNHAMFLFDSCFSGSLFRGSENIPNLLSSELAKPVRQFITAGNENQQVPDDSIFRQQFISGIEGKADLNKDGYVIGSELGQFLEKTVASYSNKSQTPIYGKINDSALDKGDFIFGQKVIVQDLVTNNPTPPIQSPQSPFSVELNNVIYKLVQAERNGNKIVFWFIALNKGGDLKTGLYFDCSLTDKDGNKHRQSERIAGGRRGGLDWLSFSIPYNVPTRFGLAFDSLPYDTEQVPFLRAKLEDGEIEFRNIPLPYTGNEIIQSTTPSPDLEQTLNNVTYKLAQVEKNGNEVIFWFIALNKVGDLKTGLYFDCSLTDKDGNEHRINARIAGGRRGGLDWLSFSIPYNVPTRFGLAFDSLPYDTEQVPFLRAKLEDGEIQFRNIPVPYN